jgi:hypothetical protein
MRVNEENVKILLWRASLMRDTAKQIYSDKKDNSSANHLCDVLAGTLIKIADEIESCFILESN